MKVESLPIFNRKYMASPFGHTKKFVASIDGKISFALLITVLRFAFIISYV